MTNEAKSYNRVKKCLQVIHALSALGPEIKIGAIRNYLVNVEGFQTSKSASSGNLYACLVILEKCKLVSRIKKEVPITNPTKQIKPMVFFHNLTATGHKYSFLDEDALRNYIEEIGIRAAPKKRQQPYERPIVTSKENTLRLQFIQQSIDRGTKSLPIEGRCRGHHYYSSYYQKYMD